MSYNQWPFAHSISMQCKCGRYFLGGSKVATKEPLACGLCYNKEMNSSSYYCDEQYKSTYPCTPGVAC